MNTETFALVEMKAPRVEAIEQPAIVRIVRTYETRDRAAEDLDLLRDATTSSFEIITVEHIDD